MRRQFQIILSILALPIMAQAQNIDNMTYEIIPDPDNPKHSILKGEVNDELLSEFENNEWYNEGKEEYSPEPETVSKIAKHINEFQVYVFLGTWCPDTRDLLPKFMKVMQETEQSPENLRLFGVDRDKNALNVEKDLFGIEHVPTFIFYKNNNEIGRIVESVDKSIEDAVLQIIEE